MALRRLHHISIIESNGTNCAWVRIVDRRKEISRSFSYRKHGGKTKAIAAAIAWRDVIGKQVYGAFWPCTHSQPRNCVASNNLSGVTGVSLAKKDNAWVAHWSVGKGRKRVQRNKYFSISLLGTRKAKKMAIARRKEALDLMLVEGL